MSKFQSNYFRSSFSFVKTLILGAVVAASTFDFGFAAGHMQEELVILPIVERILVIAGAAVVLNIWAQWKERRANKNK